MTEDSHSSQYLLMNKDVCILHFSCAHNEFGEVLFAEEEWLVKYRPIGYHGLQSFLEQRRAPKHRAHIRELLEQCGCGDMEGFLRVTHALSLNDTFWVKGTESPLNWKDVSLYRNEFNEVISRAAFDGTFVSERVSSTSPEFGTDGGYAKCWLREKDEIYLYKGGSALYEVEPLSEYLAAQLAEQICPSYTAYDLSLHHGKPVSKCSLFTSESQGLAKAGRIFDEERTMPQLLQYFSSIGSEDAFRRMCVLDALILNPDRHYENFGVLFDTETMQILCMAPVFDNNRSLFPELDEEQLSRPEWYVEKCRPRLGRDFIVNAQGVLTDAIRSDLKNLQGFSFHSHSDIEIPAKRLKFLSKIVNRQIERILLE